MKRTQRAKRTQILELRKIQRERYCTMNSYQIIVLHLDLTICRRLVRSHCIPSLLYGSQSIMFLVETTTPATLCLSTSRLFCLSSVCTFVVSQSVYYQNQKYYSCFVWIDICRLPVRSFLVRLCIKIRTTRQH